MRLGGGLLRLPTRTFSTMPSQWSRLIRFRAADGSVKLGEPLDETIDVGQATYEGKTFRAKVFEGSIFDAKPTGQEEEVREILSPVGREELGTIFCIGLNYLTHANEAKLKVPTIPIVFLKPGTALNGPYPAEVLIPKCCQKGEMADQCDYEGEVCVVIGKTGKNISKEQAMDHVLGYTSSNDVSQRKWQFKESQWTHSKSFDYSAPIGPALVHRDSVPDPKELRLKTILNGKLRQDSPVSDMIFDIPTLVSFLSQGITLEKGSIILTGTGPGVGTFFKPQLTMKDGDECRVEVSHGVGTLINKIVNE